ncbi:alpha/beta fold hydrolase [Galbitalea soli]|uniref:Alpha/beta fold hydrolase n=1 Tax=Galbitalea soli TaxID=1268042 RepID=A0A7C9TNA3_9MICO|nr:alpha/beta fold hydrolase [Galbitalea soli]NEM89955.1 alpha/beta fold hydrolase [Galbitalea soli]NYJ30661.1 3-oxoadipate enol-lactonase [Galbitalea soli]
MPVLSANGIDMNYAVDGDGPETVLLINGLADDLESWGYQLPALLDAGYRVVRFDNRGIGASSKPAGPYSTALLAADAKALVDHLGLDDYHVMGVSMGGMIAQRFALEHPSGIRSLTLASTYAAPGPFCSRMFELWADTARVMGVPTVMRDVTLWAFTLEFFQRRHDELVEFETAMRYMDQPVHAYLAQLAVIQNHDETANLAELSMPTLVLTGEQDILIPTALSHDLHELIPGSEWRTTPGGHGCIWEYPDEFNSAFVGFLRDNERTN